MNATEKAKGPLITKAVNLADPQPIKFQVKNTGYYCVATEPASGDTDYRAVVEFRNAYGELAASQIAKLPFYGGMTLAYAVMGIFWGFLYVQNRSDILPVQNYITAIIIFLVVEMLLTWGYYDYENVHGSKIGTKAFMVVVSVINAGRNSFSFFLLLIVCMGYGVVKPSLGKTMWYVRILAAAHFVFGVIYTVASMNIHPEEAGALVLLVILPLSSTLTAFYIWTLNSLNLTMKDLVERKQHVKAGMYRKLWWCILTTIIVIFGFFFFNSFTFVSVGNDDFAPKNWQTRWFILDGWLNIVYFADVAFIAYLWRPTPNNRRFAMSDEVCLSSRISKSTTDQAISLPRMTTVSRLGASVTPWTMIQISRAATRQHHLTADHQVQRRMMGKVYRFLKLPIGHHIIVPYHHYLLLSHNDAQVYHEHRLTVRLYSPSVKMRTNGAMTVTLKSDMGWWARNEQLHFSFSTNVHFHARRWSSALVA